MIRSSLLSDAEIVRKVVAGDTELFGILVERHQASLFRHALGMVGDADVAEDLVQAAFVKGFTRLRDCREPERLGAWLYRILANGCKDYLKSPRRKTQTLDAEAPFADPSPQPGDAIPDRGVEEAIQEALASLPLEQREAFLMKHVEELSYEEMADRTGASVSALKMRVMRARERLQEILRPIHESYSSM